MPRGVSGGFRYFPGGDYDFRPGGRRKPLKSPDAPESELPPEEVGVDHRIPLVFTTGQNFISGVGLQSSTNDAITWNAESSDPSAWGVGTVRDFAYSTDFYNTDKQPLVAAYDDALYVSLDNAATLAETIGGVIDPNPNFDSWAGVAYGLGRFIAVTRGGSIAQSVDGGITWEFVAIVPSCTFWQGVLSITFLKDRFFIGYTSDFLAGSTTVNKDDYFDPSSAYCLIGTLNGNSILWSSPVALFRNVGDTANTPAAILLQNSDYRAGIEFAYNGLVWAAAAVIYAGKLPGYGASAPFDTRPNIAIDVSSDGSTFSGGVIIADGPKGFSPSRIGFFGREFLFILGASQYELNPPPYYGGDPATTYAAACRMWASIDGINWTPTTFSTVGNGQFFDIAYDDRLAAYIAVGIAEDPDFVLKGIIYTSEDAVTWTERTDHPYTPISQSYINRVLPQPSIVPGQDV